MPPWSALAWAVPLGIPGNLRLADSALAQLPLASDTLASTKFSIPTTPDPGVHPRIISAIIAAPFHVYWLASDVYLNGAEPGPPHSDLLESPAEQWSQDSLTPWTFPSLSLHACPVLPEARQVKPELGSDSMTCHQSLHHSHNTLEWQGLDFLAISYSALCFPSSVTASLLS